MIEFALVLPLLLMLLVGIVTSAQAWNYTNTLEHAAREAARSGATIRPWNASAVTQVRSIVDRNLQMAGIDPAEVASCIKMGANPCDLDPSNLSFKNNLGKILMMEENAKDQGYDPNTKDKKKKRGFLRALMSGEQENVVRVRKIRPKQF